MSQQNTPTRHIPCEYFYLWTGRLVFRPKIGRAGRQFIIFDELLPVDLFPKSCPVAKLIQVIDIVMTLGHFSAVVQKRHFSREKWLSFIPGASQLGTTCAARSRDPLSESGALGRKKVVFYWTFMRQVVRTPPGGTEREPRRSIAPAGLRLLLLRSC